MDTPQPSFAKNKLFIASAVLFVLLFLTVFVFVLSQQKKQTANNSQTTNGSSQTNGLGSNSITSLDSIDKQNYTKPIVSALPKLDFSTYVQVASAPKVPQAVNVIQLKNTYTDKDAMALAQKLGMKSKTVENNKDFTLLKYEKSSSNNYFLNFNKHDGGYFFYTTEGILPTNNSTDPKAKVTNFLKQTGIWSDMMTVSNYYRRKSMPGFTFVEVHYDWDKLGLPLLNSIGIMNLAEQQRLSTARLGEIPVGSPVDADVTFSADGYAGKLRPDQFNTLLVSISDNDGKVRSVVSNLRPIQQVVQKKDTDLKTPQEAFQELQSNGSTFSLTLPVGVGYIEPDKMYPNGIAQAKSASVNDFVLMYLDDMSNSQLRYEPYYVFRGVANLDSGYRTQFLQVVPALKSNVLGASTTLADDDIGITINPTIPGSAVQYGTVVGVTGVPVTAPIQQPPDCTAGQTCTCPVFKYQYKVDGGYIAASTEYINPAGDYVRNWYFIPDDATVTSVNVDDFTCKTCARSRAGINDGDQAHGYAEVCPRGSFDACPLPAGFNPTLCIYLQYASPSLYFYSQQDKKVQVSVNPKSRLTFVDPGFTDTTNRNWTGIIGKTGGISLTNNVNVSHLYYEYERKQEFINMVKDAHTAPLASILKSDLEYYLTNNLFLKLGLNESEKNDLMNEVRRETTSLQSKYVSVSLIPQSLLNAYLPITISPTPDKIYRLHLFIQTATSAKSSSVSISPIVRNAFTVVETGVLVSK